MALIGPTAENLKGRRITVTFLGSPRSEVGIAKEVTELYIALQADEGKGVIIPWTAIKSITYTPQ